MDNVSPGSANVKWKDDVFVLRTMQADSGPTARVIEIAFAHFRRGKLAWSNSTLLRKPAGVDFSAPWVQHRMQCCELTAPMLDDAPMFEDVLQHHMSGITTPVWVGHDMDLELKALARERAIAEERLGSTLRHLVPVPSLHISVKHLAAALHPLIGRGLPEMCRRYNVDMGKTTLERAIATGKVLCAMMDALPNRLDAMGDYINVALAEATRPRGRSGIDKIGMGRVKRAKPWG